MLDPIVLFSFGPKVWCCQKCIDLSTSSCSDINGHISAQWMFRFREHRLLPGIPCCVRSKVYRGRKPQERAQPKMQKCVFCIHTRRFLAPQNIPPATRMRKCRFTQENSWGRERIWISHESEKSGMRNSSDVLFLVSFLWHV